MNAKNNNYIDNDDFADAVEECQRLGQPTERACRLFRTLAEHLVCSPKFVGYSRDDKAEMVSDALIKCIRNVKNWKSQYRSGTFSYFTRCCECSFVAFLIKHYRFVNQKKAALRRMKAECGEFDPRWGEQLDRTYGED